MIEFKCDECGQPLITEDANTGAVVQCPKCDTLCTVPVAVLEADETSQVARSRVVSSHRNRPPKTEPTDRAGNAKTLVYEVKGLSDKLEVFEDRVAITPVGVMGFLSKGLKGTKTIPFATITAIQHRRAGVLTGYLQFTIAGGIESRGGWWAAGADENSFAFANNVNDLVDEAKQYIERRMAALRARSDERANSALADPADQLAKLAKLHKDGLLTASEFAKAKASILGNM